MASRPSKKKKNRPDPSTTMGIAGADLEAKRLFGPTGRAKFSARFRREHRFQLGVDQRSINNVPGFAVIGSGPSWPDAIADAEARLASMQKEPTSD